MVQLSYTVRHAAEAVDVSESLIWEAISAGDLPVLYPSSRPVVEHDALLAWLRSRPTVSPVESRRARRTA